MMAGSKKVFATLGSSNHVPEEREAFDYYATDPKAVEMLLELEQFAPVIWEPACGEGHISKVLQAHGYPRFSLIYAPASLYTTDYIPHHGKRTVRTTETEPRYIHPTLSVICRTPDKIQNQTYGKSSGVRIRRRCLSIFRLQKTGLSLHPVRPAYGQATSRAHRRKSAERRSWRPTRR